MLGHWRLAIATASLFCILPCAPLALNQQYMGPAAVPHEFRPATAEDADSLATVFIAAFSPAPVYKYVHQFRDKYPDVDWQCLRRACGRLVANPAYQVNVITVPDESAPTGASVVSFAMWELNRAARDSSESWVMALQLGRLGSLNCASPPDSNATRGEDVVNRMMATQKTYFDDVYDGQLNLGGLGTHPEWDGNGFAAIHLHWGLTLAAQRGVPTTLLATPVGYPLYRSEGFVDVYNLTIERLDGKGEFWFEAMAHSP